MNLLESFCLLWDYVSNSRLEMLSVLNFSSLEVQNALGFNTMNILRQNVSAHSTFPLPH